MSAPATNLTSEPSDLRRAVAVCRGSFLTTAFFSLFVNLLMLSLITVVPGMPAEVLINTGERTLAQYLVKPLSDSFRRAFIED